MESYYGRLLPFFVVIIRFLYLKELNGENKPIYRITTPKLKKNWRRTLLVLHVSKVIGITQRQREQYQYLGGGFNNIQCYVENMVKKKVRNPNTILVQCLLGIS
ncbi:hypothetical protein BJ944DRAFT_233079 [Cunninghamella echinulata]|nr:hypothetical protein BJ944DRAFT_233079 [Cunninghamella echinulata]